MGKKHLKIQAVYVIQALLNFLYYISNICSSYIFYKFADGSEIPYKQAGLAIFFIIVELISFILLTSNLNIDASPYTKLFIKKYIIIFLTYILLFILRFIVLKVSYNGVKPDLLYSIVWTIFFAVTMILYIQICRNIFNMVDSEQDKLEEMENEYTITLSQDELIIFSKFRTFLKSFILLIIASNIMYGLIMKNIISMSIYTLAYMIFLITQLKDFFKFYYPGKHMLISVINSLVAGMGCIVVWMIDKDYIMLNFLNNKSLSELFVIQLLFLAPFFIWANSKYKRYQRYRYNKIINND